MSEGSLPPFGPARLRLFLKTIQPPRLREALGLLYARVRRQRDSRTAGAVRVSALESWAARAVREYLDAHAADLERAARLREKAERLEKASTPSESVRNQAERAREEVVVGLAALRASFAESTGGRDGARAFDRVVELLCPSFTPLRSPAGRT